MIVKWQFFRVGTKIFLRHTSNLDNIKLICDCFSAEAASILVTILETTRHNIPNQQDLFDAAKREIRI